MNINSTYNFTNSPEELTDLTKEDISYALRALNEYSNKHKKALDTRGKFAAISERISPTEDCWCGSYPMHEND